MEVRKGYARSHGDFLVVSGGEIKEYFSVRLWVKGLVRRESVHYQPIKSQSLDRLPELLKIDRFLDVTVDAEFVTVDHIPLFPGGSHNHHGNRTSLRLGLNLAEDFESADFR